MIVWIRDIFMRHQIDQKQWISNGVILPHAGQLHIARYLCAYHNLSVKYTVSQSQRALRTPTAAASYASVISRGAFPPTAASFSCRQSPVSEIENQRLWLLAKVSARMQRTVTMISCAIELY